MPDEVPFTEKLSRLVRGKAGTSTIKPRLLIPNDLDGQVVALPEPASWLAGALAFGVPGFTPRRRI